jgi:perosamine synthetase
MEQELAVDGGPPIRGDPLPYGSQSLDESDREALVDVLETDWLTTGPKVDAFEEAFAERVRTREAVAVANGTAALHTALRVAGVEEGDEVVVPPMTFAATANAVLLEGATPVFADVDPDTLLLDPETVIETITPRTEAIITVDFAGQPSFYRELQQICNDHDITLIADACHALGADLDGEPVGSLADLSCFSFHPVKHITTGEGGMVTTDREDWADHGRRFRHHGMRRDKPGPHGDGDWTYSIPELGHNDRLTDLQCALGLNQLEKLPAFVDRRRVIADRYDDAFSDVPGIEPLVVRQNARHSYHLYVVRVDEDKLGRDRDWLFDALQAEGIGVNVHYIPVHLQPHYQETLGTKEGMCPAAEEAYEKILTLPLFPGMTDADVDDVIDAVRKTARGA